MNGVFFFDAYSSFGPGSFPIILFKTTKFKPGSVLFLSIFSFQLNEYEQKKSNDCSAFCCFLHTRSK